MPGSKPGSTSKANSAKGVFKPYVLKGADAKRMGVPDGTRVLYTEYTAAELEIWAASGSYVSGAEILMKGVYSADGRQQLGGNLRVPRMIEPKG